ncbi:hypothetical protein GCM10026983_39120 [Gracilibacillus alcaliphilus]
MKKQMVLSILSLSLVGMMAGCNKSSLIPEENIQPEYISYQDERQPADENEGLPVTPGREQNIFEESDRFYNMRQQGEAQQRNLTTEINTGVVQEMLEATNKVRQEHGIDPLLVDPKLAEAAQKQAEDHAAQANGSSDLGTAEDMLQYTGIHYRKLVQNRLSGQVSAEQAVQEWMNQQEARSHLLDEDLTHTGVGYVSEGHYWVQLFMQRENI